MASSQRLPSRVSSEILARYAKPGEPMVRLKASNIGDVSPYELSDENGRSFIFRWNVKSGGHELLIPVSIWMENKAALAHALLDRRNPPVPLIPLFELPQEQGGQTVSCQPHTLETAGSTPAPATIPDIAEVIAEIKEATSEPSPDKLTVNTIEEAYAPFLHEAIAAKVAEKAYRVGDLAEELGASEDEVRAAIAFEGSGLHIAGAGWVKKLAE
jgi:hypothetical protein